MLSMGGGVQPDDDSIRKVVVARRTKIQVTRGLPSTIKSVVSVVFAKVDAMMMGKCAHRDTTQKQHQTSPLFFEDVGESNNNYRL